MQRQLFFGLAFALTLLACGAAQRTRPSEGAIAGLVRELGSGDPVGMANVSISVATDGKQVDSTSTSDRGLYDFATVEPGTYNVRAEFAGMVTVMNNVMVVAGRMTSVDLPFEVGRITELTLDYGDPRDGEIVYYRPSAMSQSVGSIEGTVSDAGNRDRVVGAVVTAYFDEQHETLQAIADDNGRFLFENLAPGTYSVSSYYSMVGHGQIEVKRNNIKVEGGAVAVVPLWIELAQ